LDRIDPRITGATLTGSELWLAWTVNKDSNQLPQPSVQIARVNVQNMSLLENKYISDTDSATAYPALSTNANNEVGATYMIGGGSRYPSHVVATLTGPSGRSITFGEQGPEPNPGASGGEWGNHLTVRPVFPDTRLFAAAGYTLKANRSNMEVTPQLIIFGRPKDVEAAAYSISPEPGSTRWLIKTGQDPDAPLVGPAANSIKTTVEELANLPRPADMPLTESSVVYNEKRAKPVETSIYSVEAKLILIKHENSGDYHLVLQGTSGQTMIAVAPNPADAFIGANNRWKKEITDVRQQLDANFSPSSGTSTTLPLGTSIKPRLRFVRIAGVGFFNLVHGQTGVASNGLELHPLLSIDFVDNKN
jgi:hypothetical protein